MLAGSDGAIADVLRYARSMSLHSVRESKFTLRTAALYVALIGLFPVPACLVESADPATPSAGTVDVPFQMAGDHLILPIHIGDDDKPFRIVLDTGMPARGIVLYASPRVDTLKLNYEQGQVNISGAGGEGKRLAARIAKGVDLRLGELNLSPVQVLVLPPMPQHFDFHDGIIGAELFKRYTVGIDYSRETLVLQEPSRFEAPAGAVALPMSFGGGVPFVQLGVIAADGSRSSVDVVVDLGAAHGISLNSVGPGPLAPPSGARRTVLGTGLSGDITGRIGRIAALELGGLTLRNLIAHFPDLEHQHPRGMDSQQGNLGSAILRRFDVTFDYRQKRMWLEPTERMQQPFEYNMSGMRLGRNDARELIVKQVFGDSPAADAGLRAGDVITHIDGLDGIDAQLHELRTRLREAGDEIPLTFRRGETLRRVTLRLRRLI